MIVRHFLFQLMVIHPCGDTLQQMETNENWGSWKNQEPKPNKQDKAKQTTTNNNINKTPEKQNKTPGLKNAQADSFSPSAIYISVHVCASDIHVWKLEVVDFRCRSQGTVYFLRQYFSLTLNSLIRLSRLTSPRHSPLVVLGFELTSDAYLLGKHFPNRVRHFSCT